MSAPRLHSVGLQVEPAPPRPCNRGRLRRRQWPSHEPRKSPQARQLRAALRKTLSDCWDARPAGLGNENFVACFTQQTKNVAIPFTRSRGEYDAFRIDALSMPRKPRAPEVVIGDGLASL